MKGLGKDLCKLIDSARVLTAPEDLHSYRSDGTDHIFRHLPDVVVFPETTDEVSKIVAYANRRLIPVVPRGAGSGLSGGATPARGGIVLDMKRIRRVIEINRRNMTARVECGLVLGQFYKIVEKQKLFYPPDPQSQDVCTLGGNVATRAGGPRGVKYGTTQHYVLGLEAVLPDGSIINPGGMVVKNSTGYDLTHLLTGSEGTLAVITKINLRLLPLPPVNRTAVVVCESADNAAEIVSEIIASGIIPAKLEYLTQGAIFLMNNFISPKLITNGQAYLLLELDGTPAQIDEDMAGLKALAASMKAMDVRVISDAREAATYWKARKNLHAMMLSIFKKVINEDIAVPRDRVPDFVRAAQRIAADAGLFVGLAGHAGDGNIHPTIALPNLDPETEKKAEHTIERIIKAGLELGGTISGEHGIGLHKSAFLELELGAIQIGLMKRIKAAFDPNGIMNPGKIWPDAGAVK